MFGNATCLVGERLGEAAPLRLLLNSFSLFAVRFFKPLGLSLTTLEAGGSGDADGAVTEGVAGGGGGEGVPEAAAGVVDPDLNKPFRDFDIDSVLFKEASLER